MILLCVTSNANFPFLRMCLETTRAATVTGRVEAPKQKKPKKGITREKACTLVGSYFKTVFFPFTFIFFSPLLFIGFFTAADGSNFQAGMSKAVAQKLKCKLGECERHLTN